MKQGLICNILSVLGFPVFLKKKPGFLCFSCKKGEISSEIQELYSSLHVDCK